MTLRNAFGEVSTEVSLKELVETLREVLQPFARDANDRMRIVTDTSSRMYITPYWGDQNSSPVWYSTGAPMSMDARELQEEQSIIAFQQTRTNRWVIT